MKPALGYNQIDSVDSWQQLPKGESLLALECELVREKLRLCFGQHLVKLGGLSSQIDTSECLINHQINLINGTSRNSHSGVISELDELPFQESSVDAVLANHVLEFCPDPHQVLRELHRILIANGNLVLTIVNPVSMMSFARLWPFKSHKPFWKGRFFSVSRVKDWLNLLGFEVTEEAYCGYSTLLGNSKLTDKERTAAIFSSVLPKSGAVCILVAKKRQWPLTPIRPRVRYKTAFSPAVRSASLSRISNRP